jgi:hypothetical protein
MPAPFMTWADIARPSPTPPIEPAVQADDDVLTFRLPPRKVTHPSNGENRISEGLITPDDSSIHEYDRIRRTASGQRIDAPIAGVRDAEVKRVKLMKLCNKHHLLSTCTYKNCHHDHDYVLKGREVDALRRVARMAPCRNGAECADQDCIYGHHCTSEKAKVSKKSGNDGALDKEDAACIYGSRCAFVSSNPHALTPSPS